MYKARIVGLESRNGEYKGFEWSYKGCPCCGRVQPDSRPDELGTCELCKAPKLLLDGPPDTWHVMVDVTPPNTRDDKPRRYRSKWTVDWENRDPENFCMHEQHALDVGEARSKGWEKRRERLKSA